MKQIKTKAIVLSRTNFQEADRILTLLTLDQGKVSALARGVRKERSKLAGGIELFSVNDASFIVGRGDLYTLTSTRMIKHFPNISADIDRTMLGYELLKRLNRSVEAGAEPEYFHLMEETLAILNEPTMPLALVELWFNAKLLKLGGHQPNLLTDVDARNLTETQSYMFDIERMAFTQSHRGRYGSKHIKLLRLVFGTDEPMKLKQINKIDDVLPENNRLISRVMKRYIQY